MGTDHILPPPVEAGLRRHHLAIMRNEVASDHANWIKACKELADRVTYAVIDITRNDWLEQVLNGRFDALLMQPTGWSTSMKTLYDERSAVLHGLGLPMIPNLKEIQLYENKKALAHWLRENDIPHPDTRVFYDVDEALAFLRTADHPIVAKTSLGAGGSGVRILQDWKASSDYVHRTFHGDGAPKDLGPKWRKRGFLARAIRKLRDPAAIVERIYQYRIVKDDVQRDHVLFQAFVAHDHEWRVVRLGGSFFAHKKVVLGGKASGSLLKEYGAPPLPLLDLVRQVTDAHGLHHVAIDLFEPTPGRYLVNEIQCVFGQSDPHQMIIDGVPGRYRFTDHGWVFEPGDFNRHESYLLRLENLLASLPARSPHAPAHAS